MTVAGVVPGVGAAAAANLADDGAGGLPGVGAAVIPDGGLAGVGATAGGPGGFHDLLGRASAYVVINCATFPSLVAKCC